MPRPKILTPESEAEFSENIATPVFIIGCGGYTEAIYFERLVEGRDDISVRMLKPLTPKQSPKIHDLSSPKQTVERVNNFWRGLELEPGDQVWIVLDVDHHFDGGHLRGTQEPLTEAKQRNYEVVISNPCFEVWLLMHTEEVLAHWPSCDDLVDHIRLKWKDSELRGHNKSKLTVEQMKHLRPRIREAINRGRRSANSQQMPPRNPGTQVHLLLDALDKACGSDKLF